ncbi:MAG TPA: DNA polymerase [Psychromonas sp.]
MKTPKILDVECYIDYFLISFMCNETERFREFEMFEGKELDKQSVIKIMRNNLTISFNGLGYDLAMITAALKGYTNKQLKLLSDKIITSGKPSWLVCKEQNLFVPRDWDHIDLINVAPGAASLKIYGGRLHSKKLQDLPIEPDANITPIQRDELRLYCRNDLYTTQDLFKDLDKQIKLRIDLTEKYGIDLRSKSDAQIAEAIIKDYLTEKGIRVAKRSEPVKPFSYRVPDWVLFSTDTFNSVLDSVKACQFSVNDKGSVILPKELNKAIDFYGAKYKFGIGGLHSQEKKQVVVCGEDEMFGEYDLTSMYPIIIIEQQLYPKHLTRKFLDTYTKIKDERVKAKLEGNSVVDKAYKILLNGSYGKFGSKYSYLYSPELLIQTTITGQLSLLMIIERLELAGVNVVSANTDGVNVVFKKSELNEVENIIFQWELETGYNFEWTAYDSVFSRDVNSYIALKAEGGIKGKGAYAEPNLMKNPTNEICVQAVKEYLADGVNIEDTVKNCGDVTKFISVRSVTGGAVWRDQYLGKAVRFYYSLDGDQISYKKNGNKVPKSDGSKPLMDLPESIPEDLNCQWYIDEAISLLNDLGVKYHA